VTNNVIKDQSVLQIAPKLIPVLQGSVKIEIPQEKPIFLIINIVGV
jgi:hypothetical protein